MQFQATADFSALNAFNAELFSVIERESIPNVADTHKKKIIELTSEGKDAEGQTFHDYNAGYAKRLGIPVQPKTLRRGQGRLYDLELDGDTLTVPPDVQDIALGQMTGVNGRWGYEHDFLDVSDATNVIAGEELTERIQEVLNA